MNKIRLTLTTFATLIVTLTVSSLAQAQATRTWVSGTGDDANPCTRIEPCRTFAAALALTAPGGEISVIDAGSYGPVTITKSVTINGTGTLAGIVASGTDAVTVNAAPSDVVILRGLEIIGVGTGLNGIRFVSGDELFVENCSISQFSQKGIDFEPVTAAGNLARMYVKNTVIKDNAQSGTGGGILLKPGSGILARVNIDNVQLERNFFGLRAEDRSFVTVSNSTASANLSGGFLAVAAAEAVEMNLETCVSSNNNNNAALTPAGVLSNGSLAIVRITNVTVMSNHLGLSSVNGGVIISFLNNRNHGNGVNGAPTTQIPQQ